MSAERSVPQSLMVMSSLAAVLWIVCSAFGPSWAQAANSSDSSPDSAKPAGDGDGPSVELTQSMLGFIKIDTVGKRAFVNDRTIIGILDFNQDRQLQVFTPYQGRIIALFGQVGDRVTKGQLLFTVDSADLLQAESTLVQTAGLDALTRGALLRARRLLPAGGGAQKDLDQAISDQQTAEGNLKAAREALHIFGKDPGEIDAIATERKVDSTLVVKSPIDGVITARSASPGLFIQPGVAPAPYAVANTTVLWLNGSVSAIDIRAFRVGQQVEATVVGIPGRVFRGTVSVLSPAVDPATRRLTVRVDVDNPDDVLKPGMFATLRITTGAPREATALPVNGIVREGDGTMTAWVTTDRRRFTQRTVRIGVQQNGFDEILGGVQAGELAVTDGAVFVSNVLNAPPSD